MTFVNDAPLPLPGIPDNTPAPPALQMTLIGQPQPVRIPEHLWRSWLDDPAVVSRFEPKRYRRRREQCWPWIGGVSSTGHGSFRAASPPEPSRRGTMPGAFVRLPARIRCRLEVGLVQHRRRGAVPSTRLRRLHQPGTHAVGNQSQQPPVNTNFGDATSPAHSPTFEDPRVALAPSPPRSVPGSNRTWESTSSKSSSLRLRLRDVRPRSGSDTTLDAGEDALSSEHIPLQYNAFHRHDSIIAVIGKISDPRKNPTNSALNPRPFAIAATTAKVALQSSQPCRSRFGVKELGWPPHPSRGGHGFHFSRCAREIWTFSLGLTRWEHRHPQVKSLGVV